MTARLLALTAAAVLLPATAASAEIFRGETSGGEPISFSLVDGGVTEVVSYLQSTCTTGKSGREAFFGPGPFAADGTPGSYDEHRDSRALGRRTTLHQTFSGTVAGGRATGTLRVEVSEEEYDVIGAFWHTVTCAGSVDFTATSAGIVPPPPTTPQPPVAQPPVAQPPVHAGGQQQPKKPNAKKKKKMKKQKAKRG